MSQNTSINLENKTLTISEAQLEHVDKGLRNEKAQRKDIIALKKLVREKDSIIAVMNKKYDDAVKKVFSLSESIVANQSDVNELTEDELKAEKKKRITGMYFFGRVSGNKSELHSLDFGLNYVANKMTYSVSIDPVAGESVFFGVGVGFKLFN